MKKNYKILTPFVTAFLSWLFLSTIAVIYFFNQSKKELSTEISNLSNIIKNIVVEDFKSILNNEKQSHFFLLNKIEKQSENVKGDKLISSSIKIDEENIYIDKSKIQAQFDLQAVREKLDKILPTYVNYKVVIDAVTLGSRLGYRNVVKSSLHYSLSSGNAVSIDLGIETKSSYYQNKINLTYNILLKIIVILATSISSFLYIYLRSKNKLKLNQDKLSELIANLTLKNQSLFEREEIRAKINKMFISKINELNLTNILQIDKENTNKLHKDCTNSLPFLLVDIREDYIETREFFEDLNQYFFPDLKNITLEFKSEIDQVQLTCSKIAFYQIFFSLIYNIVLFIEEQQDKKTKIRIEVTAGNITILYESLPLNKERMIILSDQIFDKFRSFFILNCRSVFNLIESNKLNYAINIKDKLNSFELVLISYEKSIRNSTVIDFSKNRKI